MDVYDNEEEEDADVDKDVFFGCAFLCANEMNVYDNEEEEDVDVYDNEEEEDANVDKDDEDELNNRTYQDLLKSGLIGSQNLISEFKVISELKCGKTFR
ncbi:hypothetical protein AgCh_001783 [Apium graveolens]